MDQISISEDQAHHFFLTSMICLQEDHRRLEKEIETRVGGRGAVYIYSNWGDSSTRQMGERSNRAGEGVPPPII